MLADKPTGPPTSVTLTAGPAGRGRLNAACSNVKNCCIRQATPKGTSAVDAAALKTLEATIAVRLAHTSDEQRAKVINTAIDILRTNSAGPEAEAEVRRILGV